MRKRNLADLSKHRIGILRLAPVIVAPVTFLLLPEGASALTRLSLALHASVIAAVAFDLALPNLATADTWWLRMRVPFLVALVSIFIGSVSDLLFRWDLDWPGMWNFLGLMILLWAVLRPREPARRIDRGSTPQS